MTDEVDFHEYQDLVHDYDHLEPGEEIELDGVDEYGEFLQDQYDELSDEMTKFWNMNEEVGRGRQGTKWRVKYKRAMGRRDQVDQVFSELSDRGFLDGEL